MTFLDVDGIGVVLLYAKRRRFVEIARGGEGGSGFAGPCSVCAEDEGKAGSTCFKKSATDFI